MPMAKQDVLDDVIFRVNEHSNRLADLEKIAKQHGAGKCLSVEQVRQAIDDLPTYMETNNITFQYVDGNIKLVEVGKFRGLFISKTDLKRKLGVG